MRGDHGTMTVERPRTPEQAVSLMRKHPGALALAGGTDLMVLWNAGLLNGKTVVDLSAIKPWTAIRANRESATIGALATHAEIQANAAIRREFPLLVSACATIGAAQIQNRGTIGGNIANASPAGDTFPALAVYEPLIQVVSSGGRRIVAFSAIFAGVKKTTLTPGELIESVDLHYLRPRPARAMFRKVGTRSAQAISKVVAAGLLWVEKGAVKELRFALGSVAPTVKRLSSAERFLAGKPLDAEAVDRACRLVEKDISPIDDIRSTRRYRLEVAKGLLRQFLQGRSAP